MTTFLKLLALGFALVLSAVMTAGLVGDGSLFIDPTAALGGFVGVLTLLTVAADYRRLKPLTAAASPRPVRVERSEFRLAA